MALSDLRETCEEGNETADLRTTGHNARTAARAGDPARPRKLLRSLLLPGQKEVHFHNEKNDRRKIVLSRLVVSGALVHVYQRTCATGEERARQECLVAVVVDLTALGVARMVLDTRRERDRHDKRTIRAVLGKEAKEPVVHEHVVSGQEQMLWIADVVAWCYGAGGGWRRRVTPLVARVVDLDTWS
ncbi:hypothetical protein [Umezawaea sp.]|uniref:hypothetical protein n=1 Tax=Umezawaea sp. TaxID=1955258 RepID=UPI002ED05EFC